MDPIASEIRRKWKPRKSKSHKGTYGRVFILAGSEGFTGAAHLCGMGALRAGAGLVTVGVPRRVYAIVAKREAEIMVKPFPSTSRGSFSVKAEKEALKFAESQDVLAIGPGLSQHSDAQSLVRGLIQKVSLPMVLDADALNALDGHTGLLKKVKGRAVITPHPGEFSRLFRKKVSNGDKERRACAEAAANQYGITVVLKGHKTVIAESGKKTAVNKSGNPGMASGGTGDVLTGMIAALVAQGFNLFDASRYGCYLHGLAGDIAARQKGEISMNATDLLGCLPQAIKQTLK